MNITLRHLDRLVVLQALLETKSVTRAAERLRMAQPNVSRALRLLREEFRDPLLVRSNSGFVATERAEQLLAPLSRLLKDAEALYHRQEFSLSEAEGSFTIATTDYTEILLAPALAKCASDAAPKLTLNFRPSEGRLPRERMERGEVDLTVLVVREQIPSSFYVQDLFRDPYVCAVRRGHPLLKGKMTLDRFTEFSHVLLNPQGTGWSVTDERLQRVKRQRHIAVGTPNALSAVVAVAESDFVLTATRGFLAASAKFFPIEVFPSPFELEPIRIAQVWHARGHDHPVNRWVRKQVKQILGAL